MYKLSYFFKCLQSGWSETFYMPTLNTSSVDVYATLLRDQLLWWRSFQTRCISIRISNTDAARDVYFVPMPKNGVPSYNQEPVNQPSDAILLRLHSNSGHSRSLAVKGVTDAMIHSNDVVAAFGGESIEARCAALVAAMQPLQIGIRTQDDIEPRIPIGGWANDPVTGNVRVQLPGLGNLSAGALANIRGAEFNKDLNKIFRIEQIGPDWVSLKRTGNIRIPPSVFGGSIQLCAYTLAPITRCEFSRPTVRKVGIPFGTPRGRR